MLSCINFIVAVFGIVSSLLTIVAFFREKLKHKITFFIVSLLCAVILVGFIWRHEKENALLKTREKIQNMMITDAQIVSNGILISGWEDCGDFIGYLSQIAGFYQRHCDRFSVEAESAKKDLAYWQNELHRLRTQNKYTSSSDWMELRGLVRSYRENLLQIAKNDFRSK